MTRPRGARLYAVLAAKLAASAAVLASGFRAVSDDDFARTVIAERWAHAPHLDPSGTSWLPFPFWLTGAAMKLAGPSLTTARATALALGLVAALLVYTAARWMGEERRASAAGAVVAAVFPWSARLGVATVPELLTAAFSLLALASLTPADDGGRRRLLGGAALLAATLSRYEVWPIAVVFAVDSVIDARRSPSRSLRPRLFLSAALALAGPAAWAAWNRAAHGDALHFVARVAGYRKALGGTEGGAPWAYPAALVREEPEIVALLAAAVLVTLLAEGPRVLWARLARYARPAAIVAVQIAALSLAMIKDAAPTHHPERALLAALLLIALAGGALAVHALESAGARLPKGLALAGAVALAFWAGRSGAPAQGFVQRADQEAIGRAAAAAVPPGMPVLVEVADYGFLAVEAALGRPEDAVPDRSVDPRDAKVPSSFDDAAALRERLAHGGARWAAARMRDPVRAVMGAPVETRGEWGLFKMEASP